MPHDDGVALKERVGFVRGQCKRERGWFRECDSVPQADFAIVAFGRVIVNTEFGETKEGVESCG